MKKLNNLNSTTEKDIENLDDIKEIDDFDNSDDDDFEDMEISDSEKEIILVSDEENKRIDVFISEKSGESRNFVQKLISDGNITVNEREVKANYG